MPYYEIKNFAAGMDVRKSALTAPAGTLRVLRNAHITPGGEISQRQSFVYRYDAPGASVGLVSMGEKLYTFSGSLDDAEPTDTSIGVRKLTYPAELDRAGLRLQDWDTYGDKFYAIIEDNTGACWHFYDGAHVAGQTGRACRTYKSKMYLVQGSRLIFSAVGNPADHAGTGAGFIDLATEDSEMKELVGIEVYYDKLAVFSELATQIWYADPDPNKDQIVQTLRQAGTYAPRSVRQYGSGDVLYLAPDGIRSLKARAQTVTASVSDIGSPLDPAIREMMLSGQHGDMKRAIALLEPLSGRYWMVMKNVIYVLSNYPNPQISAWCYYDTEFNVADAVACGTVICLRAEDGRIFQYGNGLDTPVYDGAIAEVEMPFLSFDKPATFKRFRALDCSATGLWDVYAGFNPGDENAEDLLGTVEGPTFLTGQFAMDGYSTHISLRFRSSGIGPNTLSNVMVHFTESETT